MSTSTRTSPYEYSETIKHTHMHQWSTSMSGLGWPHPFFFSPHCPVGWCQVSSCSEKPARYQRCHWLSQQVTATPAPPHWSLGMLRTSMLRRCSPLVSGYWWVAECLAGCMLVVHRADIDQKRLNHARYQAQIKKSFCCTRTLCLIFKLTHVVINVTHATNWV